MIGRHSAERTAKGNFWKTISMGARVEADAGDIVGSIGNNTLRTNGRTGKLKSDDPGVLFMIRSHYQPTEMIHVMEILKEAARPNRVPEFQSTHPDPVNRIEKIKEAIAKYRDS